MATWIVHLRVAENLLEKIPGLVAEKFALGNVGPDSGRPDEKWENFTPPSHITHFSDPNDQQRKCRDMVFYRDWIQTLPNHPDAEIQSFRLGYFFHLLTDNLWFRKIGLPTHAKFAEQFAANKDFIWEVKEDWYGLDFIYVRDHPNCIYWHAFLQAEPELAGLDFLVPESVQWSVHHIQQFYKRSDDEIQALFKRPYIYLSETEMDNFVDETSRDLFRIFKYLQKNSSESGKVDSALDLDI